MRQCNNQAGLQFFNVLHKFSLGSNQRAYSVMSNIEVVKQILGETLQLGDRAEQLTAETQLLGSIPEMDSMTVVTVLVALEEQLGIMVDDDEVDASIFETVGNLVAFVDTKTA